ncbi:MAG: hypothetical protein H6Q72_4210 [Firmicutes bacterium]|nr:hypothetical protein [Bacillota bacterium]
MKVAAYTRVSKEEQAEKDLSLPAQKERIQMYCQSQDWEIYDVYCDDGYSAKNLNRPEMKRMIQDAKAGLFNAVVVVRLDRISRSQKDVLYLIEDVFEKNNVGFKSVTQSFDTTTAFGKAAIGMLAVFAQLERDQLIERITDAKREAAKQGRHGGGFTLYGYYNNPAAKKLEINELEAKTVQFIYNEYIKGDSYQTISETLNAKKIPSPKNKEWSRVTVRDILLNPKYTGKIKHKGNLYEGKHDAIITQDEWEQVQAIAKSKTKFLPGANPGMLSGIIYCGECGMKMRKKAVWQNYPNTNPKKVTNYYVCYNQDGSYLSNKNCTCGYKHVEVIDKKAVDKLLMYSINPKTIKEELSKMFDKTSDNTKAISQAKRELSQVKMKLDKWYLAFEKGALDPDELTERVKELREQRSYLEQQLVSLEVQTGKMKEKDRHLEQFYTVLKNLKKTWKGASPEERTALFHNLVKKVSVTLEDRVSIEFFED